MTLPHARDILGGSIDVRDFANGIPTGLGPCGWRHCKSLLESIDINEFCNLHLFCFICDQIIITAGVPLVHVVVIRNLPEAIALSSVSSEPYAFPSTFAPLLREFGDGKGWFGIVYEARKLLFAVLIIILSNHPGFQVPQSNLLEPIY